MLPVEQEEREVTYGGSLNVVNDEADFMNSHQ